MTLLGPIAREKKKKKETPPSPSKLTNCFNFLLIFVKNQ